MAFYAPMKAPDHPVPSGDRRIGRGLMAALETAGFTVELACRFRAWEGQGDPARQARLRRAGLWLAEHLAASFVRRPAAERPRLWFTYHLYHKAPDWLGLAVSARLGIPYAVAEASRALKQADGPWSDGFAAADAAMARADRVFAMTARGARGVAPVVGNRLVRLAPFLADDPVACDPEGADRAAARAALAAALGLDPDRRWLVTVAMMRPGDKVASFQALARALRGLDGPPWSLLVAGDGRARPEVETAFAGLPVVFLGALEETALSRLYAAGDLFVWPGLKEGYGMVFLEAQAHGLPVVACDSGGVADVVHEGQGGRLVPPDSPEAFAHAVRDELADDAARAAHGRQARAMVAAHHDLARAAETLGSALHPLL
ncbi:glycosyltransferase family 4 protein [Roseospira marina]|uniref:Glycosyltransferase family 4 protein n=1 Tax=Roseospira marina TaxID=140057 RepID=A0A5M6IER0_9PROT|nr:glycosyltransferase family 4 protein [Roseospira marina]KAA5606766.1 glycosyltransferase family 4 protein [Roseospira marina]MBB4313812.1 glycosyltransferase involved in cell wall biosynthesis [Roseospira marina]MBB5086974.1 glycosyltransferase involved in cell wall biosynthesis [Roseospira marina]